MNPVTPTVPRTQAAALAAHASRAALLALIVLCLVWEIRFAPLRPHGSMMALKALPLLLALRGVWRHNAYTLQWAAMLVLVYFAEGIVRVMTEPWPSAAFAAAEIMLCCVFFVAALAYLGPLKRAARRARAAKTGP